MARQITAVETTETSTDKIAQLIYYTVGVINVLLLLRLIFQAFGANPRSGIVSLVYSMTSALLAPFRGIFDIAAAGESVIDPAILVALLIYSLLAKGIVELLYILQERDRVVYHEKEE